MIMIINALSLLEYRYNKQDNDIANIFENPYVITLLEHIDDSKYIHMKPVTDDNDVVTHEEYKSFHNF